MTGYVRDAFISASAAQGVPLRVVLPVLQTNADCPEGSEAVPQRRVLTQGMNPGSDAVTLARQMVQAVASSRGESGTATNVTPSLAMCCTTCSAI